MSNLETADPFFRMWSDSYGKEEVLDIVPDRMWSPGYDYSESCSGTARYQLPYVNRITAEDIFNLQGREMQNITLLTGDWTSV